jgi:hypothetical protein
MIQISQSRIVVASLTVHQLDFSSAGQAIFSLLSATVYRREVNFFYDYMARY